MFGIVGGKVAMEYNLWFALDTVNKMNGVLSKTRGDDLKVGKLGRVRGR